ncbi:MAG TPA: alpha/beta hydrolase [Gemmatimonadales bacterium]
MRHFRWGLSAGLLVLPSVMEGQEAERRLAFRPPGMESVTRQANLAYKAVPATAENRDYGDSLRYDVYRPPGSTRLPAIVFIHGGIIPGDTAALPASALPKEWDSYLEWGRAAAAAGFAAITFNHRLTVRDQVIPVTEDVRDLMRTVRARADRHGIDPSRICVAVFSAGGPLANLFLRPDGEPVRCLILYYPFMDLAHLGVHTPFRGPHARAALDSAAAWDPSRYLMTRPDSLPPLLLARAGRDAIPGINASIDRFLQLALLRNVQIDLYTHPTGAHGFDRVAGADARAAEIVEATLAFARRYTSERARRQ